MIMPDSMPVWGSALQRQVLANLPPLHRQLFYHLLINANPGLRLTIYNLLIPLEIA